MSNHPFPWRNLFLQSLREWPVVQHACERVGIERSTAYRTRHADEEFAQAWDDAMEAGIDRAEQEAFRRGVYGFEEPVIYQGQMSTVPVRNADGEIQYDAAGNPLMVPLTVRKHSDALLSLVLKGRRKKVFAERTELTGADGAPIVVDETARAARAAQLIAAAKARKDREAQDQDFGDLA